VHYLSPTEDNQHQTQKMKSLGIFNSVKTEAGLIIVAGVNQARVSELLKPDRTALRQLIAKSRA
jgi:isocitrate lyase